jgi:ribonuclease HII
VLIGVDEAGVGTLAGPLVIAAVGFKNLESVPKSVRDSKKLSAERREQIVEEIYLACAWKTIHFGPHTLIDEVGNIWLVWTRLMQTIAAEINNLGPSHWNVLTGKMTSGSKATVDGSRLVPGAECFEYKVKADETEPEVSAASVVAKYCQTCVMEALHEQYPVYGFGSHHGYPTVVHKRALTEHGPSPVHRMSYQPVREAAERRSK